MKCMDAGDRTRRRTAAGVLVGAIALVPLLAPATGQAAKAKAGPEVVDCKRLEGAAKRSCRRGNAANKTVFLQLRDSQLIGARGDGEQVDWTFCANGKTDHSTSGSTGTAINRGTDWQVENARVRNGGRSWEAEITDRDGMVVGVLRRGSQWQVAIASLGRYVSPGNVERRSAKAKCAGAAAAATGTAAARAPRLTRRCEPIDISWTTYGAKLPLAVTAKGVSCAGARKLAARVASTRGMFLPDGWTCQVETGPTRGNCHRARQAKKLTWQLG